MNEFFYPKQNHRFQNGYERILHLQEFLFSSCQFVHESVFNSFPHELMKLSVTVTDWRQYHLPTDGLAG